LDDLYKNVREFASIELIQQQFPGGWFFAVFELFCDNVDDNKTASATQTKKISENQGIDNQRLLNELIDVGSCNDVWQTSEVELQIEDKDQIPASISCQPNMDTHRSKTVNPANPKSHSKGKKRKLTEYVKTNKKSQQSSNIPNSKVIDSEDNFTNKKGKKGKTACSEKKVCKTSKQWQRSHFMNSVFEKPGVYSCAVDCFLEVSTYLFLPSLAKLSIQSEFFQLLFNNLSKWEINGNR